MSILPNFFQQHLFCAQQTLCTHLRVDIRNYSKFIRATDPRCISDFSVHRLVPSAECSYAVLSEDVIKQMKFTIEGLDPDLKVLDGNVSRTDSSSAVVKRCSLCDTLCGEDNRTPEEG